MVDSRLGVVRPLAAQKTGRSVSDEATIENRFTVFA